MNRQQESPEWAGIFSEQSNGRDCLRSIYLSKLSQLKQEAYQAGKKREWVRAVSVYEQMLELDKNNPTVINELGDLCLKAGDTSRGVKHFLGAAAKYRQTGLLNNAVAIYKKIIRYEAENQNAHWYLAESRANQGLLVEGEQHGLVFLSNSEGISGEIKEIFLKRCVKLFELYAESLPIQDNLLQVFRMWNLPQEAGRSQIQLGCLQWKNGEHDTANKLVAEALDNAPELANYPEYARWMKLQGISAPASGAQDFDSVSLDDPFAASEPTAPNETTEIAEPENFADSLVSPEPVVNEEPPAAPVIEIPTAVEEDAPPPQEPDNNSFSFGDVDFETPVEPAETFGLAPEIREETTAEVDIPDEGGCFNIDMGEESSFEDLIAQASEGLPAKPNGIEEFSEPDQAPGNEISISGEAEKAEEPVHTVNLLDELLAEDSSDNWSSPEGELKTISEEIGTQVGGASNDEDPSSLYEMGMVYLEMDLHDQAADSFQKASCHGEFAIRAYEMWGITLQRAGKIEEAIAVLTDGLDVPEEGSREYLGLLYHIARSHEQDENNQEAQRLFKLIHNQDSGFLDVGRRLLPS